MVQVRSATHPPTGHASQPSERNVKTILSCKLIMKTNSFDVQPMDSPIIQLTIITCVVSIKKAGVCLADWEFQFLNHFPQNRSGSRSKPEPWSWMYVKPIVFWMVI